MWYHVSTDNLGKTKMFYPRRMRDATYERPAICVAPSAAQCILAMPSSKYNKLYVYVTKAKAYNRYTKQIFDYDATNEHRIYVRTSFRLCGVINDPEVVRWIKKVKIAVETLDEGDCFPGGHLKIVRRRALRLLRNELSIWERDFVTE